jgi:ERCC4-type nuclease
MKLIIDNRETALYEKCQSIIFSKQNYTVLEEAVLPIGDILVKTDEGRQIMIIERKTLTDLLASIKDGRYEEQSHRLKHASGFRSHNIVYIIEGVLSTLKSPLEKKIIYSTITSLNHFKGFSVIRTSCVQETAEFLVCMADKIDRNIMKGIFPAYLNEDHQRMLFPPTVDVRQPLESLEDSNPTNTITTSVAATSDTITDTESFEPSTSSITSSNYSQFVKKVKKENITEENIGEIMLCQIPGISSIYAVSILKHFDGFSKMIQEVKNKTANFDNIQYEINGKKRRVPRTCGESITKYFIGL